MQYSILIFSHSVIHDSVLNQVIVNASSRLTLLYNYILHFLAACFILHLCSLLTVFIKHVITHWILLLLLCILYVFMVVLPEKKYIKCIFSFPGKVWICSMKSVWKNKYNLRLCVKSAFTFFSPVNVVREMRTMHVHLILTSWCLFEIQICQPGFLQIWYYSLHMRVSVTTIPAFFLVYHSDGKDVTHLFRK